MRGRKPQPTALKILQGVRSSRINESEPVYPAAEVKSPPEWLGEYGRQRWKELYPLLQSRGVLTEADLPAFEQLCDEYDTIRRDPLSTSARDRYRKLLIEFGLTPSSRSRIKSTAEKPPDALQEFLVG